MARISAGKSLGTKEGGSSLGMEDGPFGQPFDVVHCTGARQRHLTRYLQRFAIHPTWAVRSSRVATALGGRPIHRSTFSGKQGLAAPVSIPAWSCWSWRLPFLSGVGVPSRSAPILLLRCGCWINGISGHYALSIFSSPLPLSRHSLRI